MTFYDEPGHRQTKLIKKGLTTMPAPSAELASWIADRFHCPVPLNVVFEWCELAKRPRLHVIFERRAAVHSFRDEVGNYDSAKQALVQARFLELRESRGQGTTDTEGMFVIFTAFEPLAREEANSAMDSWWRLWRLRRALASPMIWRIYPQIESVVFFLHTDAQLAATEGTPFRDRCRTQYEKLLKSFDEFGYFEESPIDVQFYSRETFERDYEGNWGYFAHR